MCDAVSIVKESGMRTQKEILREIQYIKEKDIPACIFGAGKIGVNFGYDFLRILDIKADCYSDNDSAKWGREIIEGIRCKPIEEIEEEREHAYFIMAGNRLAEEIKSQLKEKGISLMITYPEICSLDRIVDHYFNEELYRHTSGEEDRTNTVGMDAHNYPCIRNEHGKDIAIYTCITGDYDDFREAEYIAQNCDYFLISDKKPDNISRYIWIDASEVIPTYVKDNVRRNRFCKINGDILFSNYRYSIYIDGNALPKRDISDYILKLGRSGIACHKHLTQQCLYIEAIRCIKYQRDSEVLIKNQMCKYLQQKMPRGYGGFECSMLVRENHNDLCRKVMRDWWREVYVHSARDQLSFTYSLWKNGLRQDDVGVLGEGFYMNNDFIHTKKHG